MTVESEEYSLRPQDWDEYIGQEKLKSRLQVSMQGALSRDAALGHILLAGPPGYGKTSLAALVADEMMEDFHSYVMPLKPKDLTKIFLDKKGVIFLDEIHRLKNGVQEMLLPILEDFEIPFEDGKKIKIKHKLTVIGATTEIRKVIEPLRDRFDHKPKFELYTDAEMAAIVERMAERAGAPMRREHAKVLGRASAGVPRQARTLVYGARDLGTSDPRKVLHFAGVTEDGLTEDHLEYLHVLNKLNNKAGIDAIMNYMGQPKDVIMNIERLLIRKNFIIFTQTGRELTTKGWELVSDERTA